MQPQTKMLAQMRMTTPTRTAAGARDKNVFFPF
jgi:hypothetical protein